MLLSRLSSSQQVGFYREFRTLFMRAIMRTPCYRACACFAHNEFPSIGLRLDSRALVNKYIVPEYIMVQALKCV